MLSICMEGFAQVSGMDLSYCNGEMNTKGTITSTKKDAWVSAAIYIPVGTINTYDGNHIDSIRVALASKLNIDTLKVWVRNELDGENLAEGTILSKGTPSMVKGWNRVALNDPYAIAKSDKGLYIGYSFHQKGASFGISSLATPAVNGLFVKLPGEEWADRGSEGTLCVEGLVYGESLPKVNLTLLSVDAQDVYVLDKGKLSITGQVKNVATQTITGFDVEAKVDGLDKAYTAHVDLSVPYKATKTFSVVVNPEITEVGNGKGKVTVTVANLNEGDDEDPTDNVLADTFKIVSHDFTRNIFVEEFTTEDCANCPRMASYIHNALEKDEYKDRVLVACHHSGFYTDWLTKTCDTNYLWFFNAGGATYAPAIMIDRANFGGSTPVIGPTSQGQMEAYWDYSLNQSAFVSVNVAASVLPGSPNKLHIDVSGTKSIDKLCDNPRLTVYVLEDNIAARSQAGASSFTHNHVKRAFNSTWGDQVEWNGDDYSYSCEFDVSTEWVKENLQVVAFIYNYDENDPTNCTVANAGSAKFSDFNLTGIENVTTTTNVDSSAEYYTLTGAKVAADHLGKGVYIVKKNGKTQKVMLSGK